MIWNRSHRAIAGVALAVAVVAVPVAALAATGASQPSADASAAPAAAVSTTAAAERAVGNAPAPVAQATEPVEEAGADDAPEETKDEVAPTESVAPASEATDAKPDTRPADSRSTDSRPTDTRPSADKPTETHPDRPSPHFDCAAHRTDQGVGIGCKWTEVGEDRAAGYRLWRAVDDQGRQVVFETRDLSQHGYRDADVKPGHTYHYAVQYLAADGSVIVTSRVVRIEIPADRLDVEALRLACEQAPRESADAAVVACKWSSATTDRAVGYKLIRRDAEGREVVARGGLEFTSHREKVRPGRYSYRVVAVDADGHVVGASEAVAIHVER